MRTLGTMGYLIKVAGFVGYLVCIIVLLGDEAFADVEVGDPNTAASRPMSDTTLGLLGYVDFSVGETPLPGGGDTGYSRFSLTRGYLTAKRSVTEWLRGRITVDVKQEAKVTGTDLAGSYAMRLKYLYAELGPRDLGFITEMKLETGMGHMPWLDFEEHINPYRCQGPMAAERAHIFNSADLGLSLQGYLGPTLADAKRRTGSSSYAGRWGSWHIGVYNGGGYHEAEANQNKVVEGRLTVRPLPQIASGLQLSWFGLIGDGNKVAGETVSDVTLIAPPAYRVSLGMVSFEHPVAIVAAQFFTTKGNKSGTWITPEGSALNTSGWSIFAKAGAPEVSLAPAIFGRFDWFDIDPGDAWQDRSGLARTIGGLALRIHKGNMLLLAWERVSYGQDASEDGKLPIADRALGNEQKFQVVWQIEF